MVDVPHCFEQDENREPTTHKQTKIKTQSGSSAEWHWGRAGAKQDASVFH